MEKEININATFLHFLELFYSTSLILFLLLYLFLGIQLIEVQIADFLHSDLLPVSSKCDVTHIYAQNHLL